MSNKNIFDSISEGNIVNSKRRGKTAPVEDAAPQCSTSTTQTSGPQQSLDLEPLRLTMLEGFNMIKESFHDLGNNLVQEIGDRLDSFEARNSDQMNQEEDDSSDEDESSEHS